MRTLLLAAAIAAVMPTPVASQQPSSQSREIISLSGLSYTLQPGDILRVEVWGRPEYSGLFQVNEEGQIYYPALGIFDAKTVTVGELRDSLLVGLEELFTRPFVSVTPLFRVSVLGRVMRPGLYNVDPTLTIMDVIALAGGPTNVGNMGKIKIFRDGQFTQLSYETEALLGSTLKEIGIRSGDDIIVPRKLFARDDATMLLQLVSIGLSIAIFINTLN